MKTILVDNDIISMQEFETRCSAMPDIEIVEKFTSPLAAWDYATRNSVDFALLAIEMSNMNGFELYDSLKQIRPEMMIVFSTTQEIHAAQAIKKNADYILFKPYQRETVLNVLSRIKLLSKRLKKRVYCRTFGHFDIFSDDLPIVFRSAKAKEILALCVYRQGAPITSEEIIEKLWEHYTGTVGDCSVFRYTIKQLVDTLKLYHVSEVFQREKGICHINNELLSCDYYDFLRGDPDTITQFQDKFMVGYSWAEPALYSLQKKKMLSTHP